MTRPRALAVARSAALSAAAALAVGWSGSAGAAPLSAQERLAAGGTPVKADSTAILDEAREAQARFERHRRRYAPRSRGSWGGSCDEVVGRMCMRVHGGSDWWPGEEREELIAAREALIDRLAAIGASLPGDIWVMGQRVFYLVEAGRPGDALAVVEPCGTPERWWCEALAGFALHAAAQYPAAEAAFDLALEQMPDFMAEEWLDPEWLLDGDGRGRWKDLPADSVAVALTRYWALSDPFQLVAGNDFRTEILARRVVEQIRADARNAYQMRWGDDLAELLVRYGWEIGWEVTRSSGTAVTSVPSAVGHQHPESRDFAPPGSLFDAPLEADAEAWNPGDRHPQTTGYAPAYAPVVTPPRLTLRRLPHGETVRLVADIRLDADTTYHASHGHAELPVPDHFRWREPEIGLFLTDLETGEVLGERLPAGARVADVEVPAGRYLLSAEVLDPSEGRAGLHREVVELARGLPDGAVLSDLLVTRGDGSEPETVDAFVTGGLESSFTAGDRVLVGWEVYGLGWREEALEYRVSLVRASDGLLKRAGRFLGLVGPPTAVELGWTEPGPDKLGPVFRAVSLALPPELDAGEYRLRVEMLSAGRGTLVAEETIEVRAAR